jgi:hypothetical protein
MWNDKPDGYSIPIQNPTGTGMNFYPRVQVQISTCSLFTDGRIIALPDLLPSLTSAYYPGPRWCNHHITGPPAASPTDLLYIIDSEYSVRLMLAARGRREENATVIFGAASINVMLI